jgi:hypothetical protein
MQWGRAAAGICECWRDAGESLALVFGLCRWFANFGRLSFVIYRTAQISLICPNPLLELVWLPCAFRFNSRLRSTAHQIVDYPRAHMDMFF